MRGIYKITNLETNEFYIGSTTQSFIKRKTKHFNDLKNNVHTNPKLQSCYNNFGKDFLKFDILEECSQQECLEREQFYIDDLKPHYNVNKKASNSFGTKRSQEFKEAISKRKQEYYNSENNNKKSLSETNSKYIYKIFNIKSNSIIFEDNCKEFCKKNNLKESSFHSTHSESKAIKKYHKHKGFKILEKIDIEEMLQEYSITKQF